MIPGRKRLWCIYRNPLLISCISSTGLISALLLDGPADVVSSMMVGVPLLVFALLHGGR